jgi:hypothetical protein
MRCLIAFDGLSGVDIPRLLELLPKSSSVLNRLKLHSMTSPSSTAQAAWAEVLTGVHWSVNACGGYSRPNGTLNQLSTFSEFDLLKPVLLADDNESKPFVVINLPILLPKPNRIWLSDGSLPTNNLVSPKQLLKERCFKEYLPRAYPSHAFATTASSSLLIRRCIEVETIRLRCAVSIFKQHKFSCFIYRLSIFDYLFHILGLNFLGAKDLAVYAELKEFLRELDSAIEMFSEKEPDNVAVVSAYSHIPCRMTLNLNDVLSNGGFLKLTKSGDSIRNDAHRLKVATALQGWEPSTHYLASQEGQLDTSSTIAASPVAGCVFINKRTTFFDGIVEAQDVESVATEVENYLRSFCAQRFGQFKIEKRLQNREETYAPDFMVDIESVEFHNLSSDVVAITPLTTHSSKGFVMLPKGCCNSENIRATQLASFIVGATMGQT